MSPWVQQTSQFTPLVLELSLIRSHLLWEEFSAFSAVNVISQFSIFCSTTYPLLLGGQTYGMRGFAQHLYTWINFSDLRELVNFPCATICVRQTASLYQQVLHSHSGSVVGSTGRHQTATPYICPKVRQWGANSGPQPWESGAHNIYRPLNHDCWLLYTIFGLLSACISMPAKWDITTKNCILYFIWRFYVECRVCRWLIAQVHWNQKVWVEKKMNPGGSKTSGDIINGQRKG